MSGERRMRCFPALLAVVVALGCRQDEAGVASGDGAPSDRRFAEVVSVARIIPSSGEGYDLNRVRTVRTLSDQRIAVLNAGSSEVLVFSLSGSLDRRFGGAGQGPAEFTNTVFMSALAGDSILVTDFDMRGAVFTSSGAVGRTFTLERRPGGMAYVSPMGITAAGELVGAEGQEPATMAPGMTFMPTQFVVHGLTGSFLRGFQHEGIGNEAFVIVQGERMQITSPPLRRRPFVAAGPAGLALASSGSRDVVVVDAEGVVQRTVQAPREIAAPERRRVDSVRAAWAELPATEPGRVLRRRAALEMPVPTARPVVADLRMDHSGRLWVADAAEDGTAGSRWYVYDGAALLGFVDLPEAINVKEIGADYLLAVATDALGVESVIRITLNVLPPE